jgi:hypothetical protein
MLSFKDDYQQLVIKQWVKNYLVQINNALHKEM